MKTKASVFLALSICLIPSIHADTTVSTDTTQNGGTFAVSPPVLLVTASSGDPTLTLTNGATASWAGSTIIGNLSGQSGNIEVLNGSSVSSSGSGIIGSYGSVTVINGEAILGLNSASSGSAVISGSGSDWTINNTFYVGSSGTGALTVSDGGSVSSGAGTIGRSNGSRGGATVTGASSQWSINGNYADNLVIGLHNGSQGELTIANGGQVVVTNGSAHIGLNSGSQGKLTVSGTNSQLSLSSASSFDFNVGKLGAGELIVTSGGKVSVSGGQSFIGAESGSQGTATVSGEGSTWETSGYLRVGLYFGSNNNTLTVEDGGLVKVGDALGETITFSSGSPDSYLRIDGGYIALFGDQNVNVANLLTAGRIQLWDGSAWVTALAEDVEVTYYANDAGGEAAALEDTGYEGLGGYTVATVQAVPEPSTWALIGLGAAALIFARRKRTA